MKGHRGKNRTLSLCLIMLLSFWHTGAQARTGLPTSGMVVALVSRVTGSDFFAGYRSGAEKTATALGMTLLVIPAGATEQSQRAAVEKAVALKARGIILNDVVGPYVDAVLAPALQAGLPVVSFDSTPTDPHVIRIGQDDAAIARLVATQALADHKTRAHVLVVHITGFPETDRRYAVWHAMVSRAGWSEQTLETPATGDVPRQAEERIAQAIRHDPMINMVYAPWDQLDHGAVAALRDTDTVGTAERSVYGSDITPAVLRELGRQGTAWVGTAGTNPSVMGAVCVRTLALHLVGAPLETSLRVAPILLTARFVRNAGIRRMDDLERLVPAFVHSRIAVAPWMPSDAH